MLKILFLFFITSFAYSQIGNRTNKILEYQAYLTKEEINNLLENFETDSVLRDLGFSLKINRKSYEIYKDDSSYAIISKIPQNSLFLDNCDEIIPLFELNCTERRSPLFGVLVVLESKIER